MSGSAERSLSSLSLSKASKLSNGYAIVVYNQHVAHVKNKDIVDVCIPVFLSEKYKEGKLMYLPKI